MAQIGISQTEQKEFRKTAISLMKKLTNQLAEGKTAEEALPIQQRIASVSVMVVESYSGRIEDHWQLILEDVFDISEGTESDRVIGKEERKARK